MNIQIMSDLHLEHCENFQFQKKEGADVLILAGDISSQTYQADFVRKCAEQIPTIMIMGNHEPLGTTIDKNIEEWKALKIPNLFILNNETVILNGVKFIGTTLWSDLGRSVTNNISIQQTLVEFKKLFKDESCENLIDIPYLQDQFNKSLAFIEKELFSEDDLPQVLITHHAPTFSSVGEKYERSTLNSAFASNLDHMLSYAEHLKLCVHGHVHDSYDYMLGDTLRVVCNPRGYHDSNTEFDPLKCVSI